MLRVLKTWCKKQGFFTRYVGATVLLNYLQYIANIILHSISSPCQTLTFLSVINQKIVVFRMGIPDLLSVNTGDIFELREVHYLRQMGMN